MLCDLLWSDPVENFDDACPKKEISQFSINTSISNLSLGSTNFQSSKTSDYFIHNSARGCSFNYSQLAVKKFLEENNLLCLIRAHQVQREGIHLYSSFNSDFQNKYKDAEFPSIISIFSAPNYCDVYQNKGAIIQYTGLELNVKVFTASDHPFVLSHFQDAFSWSLPFIYDKITEILMAILKFVDNKETSNLTKDDLDKIGNILKIKFQKSEKLIKKRSKKIEKDNCGLKTVKKYHQIYRRDSIKSESDLKLRSLSPSNRLRRRSSDTDRELLARFEEKGTMTFEDAKDLDSLQYKIINSDVKNN